MTRLWLELTTFRFGGEHSTLTLLVGSDKDPDLEEDDTDASDVDSDWEYEEESPQPNNPILATAIASENEHFETTLLKLKQATIIIALDILNIQPQWMIKKYFIQSWTHIWLFFQCWNFRHFFDLANKNK